MDLLEFSLGVLSSFLIHEAGHVGVSYLTGGYVKKYRWEWETFGYLKVGGSLPSEYAGVLAGNLAQLSAGKLSEDKGGAFWKGFTLQSYLNPFLYSIRGNGDFKALQKNTAWHRDTFRLFYGSLSGLALLRHYARVNLQDTYELSAGNYYSFKATGIVTHGVDVNAYSSEVFNTEITFGVRPIQNLEIGLFRKLSWRHYLHVPEGVIKDVFRRKDFEGLYVSLSYEPLSLKVYSGDKTEKLCGSYKNRWLCDTTGGYQALSFRLEVEKNFKSFFIRAGYDSFYREAYLQGGIRF